METMRIDAVLQHAIAQLKVAGIEAARLEAELLLMRVTNFTRVQLLTHGDAALTSEQKQAFEALIKQRLLGHPIAYILGERDFWDLKLKVTPDTLIPRPDTEILVEHSLNLIDEHKFKRVLDLGTGSGAIILALKHSRPHIDAHAVDISASALKVAQENAFNYALDVNFFYGSWFCPLVESNSPRFDLIVSNPPYIEEFDYHLEQGDVRFEPRSALVSGKDGLDDIKQIAFESKSFLTDQGYLVLEHGYKQGEGVRNLLSDLGYSKVTTLMDLAGLERVTVGCHNEA